MRSSSVITSADRCPHVGVLLRAHPVTHPPSTLRAAGHIVSEGNTLLSSFEGEQLTILRLRMNREYMDYMRANFAHIIRDQKFNTTVVSPTMDPPMDPRTGPMIALWAKPSSPA